MTSTPLKIHTLPLGPLEANCYVLTTENDCWLVDVGMWSKPLVEYLKAQGLTPSRVLLTHGHGDHIGGIDYLRNAFPAVRVACPEGDLSMIASPEENLSATFLMGITAHAEDTLQPGDTLDMDGLTFIALHTPGHSPGGTCYYCAEAGVCFTGDTLFAGSIGRSDLPNGDAELLAESIREKLYALPAMTRIFPGHGGQSTIGEQSQSNPFVRL